MPELDPAERLAVMRNNADHVNEGKYFKVLTEDELAQRMRKLADNSIKLSELDDEKKEAVAEFKEQMDPLAKDNKVLMGEIRTRQRLVDGTLFLFADHESGMMNTYDELGELVSSRRLFPEEKQTRATFMKKVAE